MSVPLRPQQHFTVVRQIANHLDAATYYVRAVIRNAYTDELLDTLDLDSKGAQRYTKNWRAPADPSGQGFYISIITSVYTDSGYTTKSENYGDEENTHLVSSVFAGGNTGGGGGVLRGSGSLDAYTVRRIVGEELDKRTPEPVTPPPPPEMRFGEVLASLEALKTAVSALPTTTTDTQPVLASLEALRAAVEAKPVTPPTDLTPVLQAFQTLTPELQTGMRNFITLLDDASGRISQEMAAEIAKQFSETEFAIAPSTARIVAPERKPDQEPVALSLDDLAA